MFRRFPSASAEQVSEPRSLETIMTALAIAQNDEIHRLTRYIVQLDHRVQALETLVRGTGAGKFAGGGFVDGESRPSRAGRH